VEWRKTLDRFDQRGYRHLAYRQHYRPPDLPPETAALRYGADGVPMEGAGIGLHFRDDASLRWVTGSQHLDVKATASLNVTTPHAAFLAAQAGAGSWPGYEVGDPATWREGLLQAYLERAALSLACRGPAELGYVWKVATMDARGQAAVITLDADSAMVVDMFMATPWSQCEPSGHYEMVPLREVYGPGYIMPAYLDYGVSSPLFDFVPGRAAGDAAFFTFLTMGAIADISGYTYCGFDGSCVEPMPAKVVVDAYREGGEVNNAFFSLDPAEYYSAPEDGVGVCPMDGDWDHDGQQEWLFRNSAALDIIAHEWGHGVIQHAGIDRNLDAWRAKFHEGYADIIGHMVEGLRQPWGPGEEYTDFETFDWEYSEDVYQPGPPPSDANHDCGTGNDWVQRRTPLWSDCLDRYWSLHRDDPCLLSDAYNCEGSRLVEVFYLLTKGGYNKICAEKPTLFGCKQGPNPVKVTPLDGDPRTAFDLASEILFHALVNNCPSISPWDGNWINRVGVQVGLSAEELQGAAAKASVYQAFTAIGYPPGLIQ